MIEPCADTVQRAEFDAQLSWDRVAGHAEAQPGSGLEGWGPEALLLHASLSTHAFMFPSFSRDRERERERVFFREAFFLAMNEQETLPLLLLDRLPPLSARAARDATTDGQGLRLLKPGPTKSWTSRPKPLQP